MLVDALVKVVRSERKALLIAAAVATVTSLGALALLRADRAEDTRSYRVEVELVQHPHPECTCGHRCRWRSAPGTSVTAEAPLLRRAQDEYVSGRYQAAIDDARHAMIVGAEAMPAWRVIGASACFEHDTDLARTALPHLDGAGRQMLRHVCERNGTELR